MDYTSIFAELEWLQLRETKQLIGEKPVQIFIATEPDYYTVEIYLGELCIYSLQVEDWIRLDVLKSFLCLLFNVEEITL